MLNSVSIMGRLVADVELRRIERKKDDLSVAAFTVAVDRDYIGKDEEREADFIRCKAFGHTAEFIEKYFSKGSMVCICGRIQTGKYENRNGDTVYTTEVIAENVYFTGEKAKDSGSKKSKGKSKRRYDDDDEDD